MMAMLGGRTAPIPEEASPPYEGAGGHAEGRSLLLVPESAWTHAEFARGRFEQHFPNCRVIKR